MIVVTYRISLTTSSLTLKTSPGTTKTSPLDPASLWAIPPILSRKKTSTSPALRLLLFSKLLAQPSFHYFFGQLWLQNFKQLFLTHFCTDSLDCLSKCVLLIITEVPVSLSKQYYWILIFQGVYVLFSWSVNFSARYMDSRNF